MSPRRQEAPRTRKRHPFFPRSARMDPDFLRPEASEYLESLRVAMTPTLARLEREAKKEDEPASNPQTGAMLRVLAAASGGHRVLEIGTNLGYGALCLLSGMPKDGRLETIELDPGMVKRAQANFQDAKVADRVIVHQGAALEVLPRLAPPFDLVYIDCVKEEYPAYLDHALRLTRPGGIIAADNLFWHGQIWDPRHVDPATQALRAYTNAIRTRDNLVSTLVPTGDGLAVSVVRAKP